MITGQITISLEVEPDSGDWGRDRRALQALDTCPDGATVLVRIGRRRSISQDAATILHEHDHRLALIIDGAYPDVLGSFIQAARAGEWAVI